MIVRGGTFGPVATNTYVVADREGGSALIVDPAAGSSGWVAAAIDEMRVTPVAVLNTHGHWDHVVENHIWDAQGIPVWVGRGDEEWLAAPAPFNPALFGNPPPTPGVTPAAILEDGDTIPLTQSSRSPQLDEILSTLQGPERKDLQVVIQQVGLVGPSGPRAVA
ncbi:MAG: MBL fold metallo-hydrolase, partial [Thermoleophilia bacterium]|nr:MBL fold metallo-hydrolase [Thermoleophilia bacterium]